MGVSLRLKCGGQCRGRKGLPVAALLSRGAKSRGKAETASTPYPQQPYHLISSHRRVQDLATHFYYYGRRKEECNVPRLKVQVRMEGVGGN